MSPAPLVLVLLGAASLAGGAETTVRYRDYALVEARSLSALPREVRNLFDRDGGIADRGEEFNSSDVVRKGVPMRRFAVAGLTRDFALIAVEHGGFAYRVAVLEFSKTGGKWTMGPRQSLPKRPANLAELVKMLAPETAPAAGAGERTARIYYSAAPWDGAAYSIEIPQEKSADAPDPVIRVSIWGYPEFPDGQTIRFTGKEDTGGGPGKGDGHAAYQAVFNKSWPDSLAGTIVFTSLVKGKPVAASYELTSTKGKTFKGTFTANWGNEPPGVIR